MDSIPVSPWRTIWFSPRQTIGRIVNAEVRPTWVPVIALSALHFSVLSLEGDENGGLAIRSSLALIAWDMFDLAFHIVAGPFFAAYVARWFGRNSPVAHIREATVWSYVPFASSVFLWIPGLLLFGPLAARPDAPDHVVLLPGWIGVTIALSWSLVLGVVTLAEVIQVGVWKALAITLIASIPAFIIYAVR